VEICYAERTCQFYSYDTTDRDSITRWHHLQRQLCRQSAQHEGSAPASAAEEPSSYTSGSSGSSHSSHSQSRSAGRPVLENGQQRHLSATLQSVLPLPPADCVVAHTAKEAHFYRFVASCSGAAAVFDVCVDDLATGQRRK
jgi:hypothetical protein